MTNDAGTMLTPPDGFVIFARDIWPTDARALLTVLNSAIEDGLASVLVSIASPGGGVGAGLGLFNTLQALPIEVRTHNAGNVGSIANVVFVAGEHRSASPISHFMFHPPEEQDPIEERCVTDALVSRIGLDAEAVAQLKSRETLLTPAQAKDAGIVEKVENLVIPPGSRIWVP